MKNFKGGPQNFLIALVLVGLMLMVLTRLTEFTRTMKPMIYSQFMEAVEQGVVKWVRVENQQVTGALQDGSRFETVISNNAKIWDLFDKHKVSVEVVDGASQIPWFYVLILLLMLLIPLVVWYLLRQSRNANGGAGNIFSMGKSKAKMFMPQQITVNFNDVAGAVEAKEELFDVVDFLKNPDKYRKLGAQLTKGVLLVGEPGNGKTLLAKAVAGEANCPFFSISGSEFIEVFVGVGPARVRDLFAQARRYAPSIIFIDEIDAVGRQRGMGMNGGHDEREQTLNQLLTEMDGFESGGASVVVIGATNRPDVLDKALLRPGRFDRKVYVPYPDVASRESILKVHARNVKIDTAVDLKRVARATPGFTGADLAHLINEAAINASKHNQEVVRLHDFEEARDKIMLGKERKTIIFSEQERRVTAFHEAGHALVRLMLPETSDPLHKVTIVPRGMALGVTWSLPERDKYVETEQEMLAQIMVAFGGRIAEELVFKQISSGASNDFKQATNIIRKMVCDLGMSPVLGPLVFDGDYHYSDITAKKIDEEIRRISAECYEQATDIIKNNMDKLEKLAQALLEREILQAGEIYELLGITPREEHTLA